MARTKGSKNKNSTSRTKKVVSDTIVVNDKKYTLKKLEITDEGRIDKVTATVEDLMRRIDSGKLNMNPLIQRTPDQWSSKQRSKLILSIIKSRPIGTITVSRSDGINEVLIDGLQRLTTIRAFLNDDFPLSKEGSIIKCVWADEDDPDNDIVKDIDIGGKRFSQLPELFRDYITECRVDFHIYWHFDDEEMEDIMFCMNNGSPFKPWQKIRTRLGETRVEKINDILDSTAWEKIHGCNSKNDTNLGLVIRSMMLLDGCGFNGLNISAAEKFVERLSKDGTKVLFNKIAEVAKLFEDFDYVATSLPVEDWSFFDVTNTPQVIYNIEQFNRSGKNLDVYAEFIHKFINDELDDEENNIREYNNVKKRSKGSGTAMKANAITEARQWIIDNAMSEYIHGDEDEDVFDDTNDTMETNNINEIDDDDTVNATVGEIFNGFNIEVKSVDDRNADNLDNDDMHEPYADNNSDDDLMLFGYDKASSY